MASLRHELSGLCDSNSRKLYLPREPSVFPASLSKGACEEDIPLGVISLDVSFDCIRDANPFCGGLAPQVLERMQRGQVCSTTQQGSAPVPLTLGTTSVRPFDISAARYQVNHTACNTPRALTIRHGSIDSIIYSSKLRRMNLESFWHSACILFIPSQGRVGLESRGSGLKISCKKNEEAKLKKLFSC